MRLLGYRRTLNPHPNPLPQGEGTGLLAGFSSRRSGFTLTEVTLALVIAATAAGGLAQLLFIAAGQRRATEQRRLAVQEVANVAERIAALSWDQLTDDWLAAQAPSAELLSAIPQAKVRYGMTAEAGPPAARRIRLEVTWQNTTGQPVDPAGLTVWKYSPPEQQP